MRGGFRLYLFGGGFLPRASWFELAVGAALIGVVERVLDSLVIDIVVPIAGIAGRLDYSNYFLGLSSGVTATMLEDTRKQGGVIAYGHFVTTLLEAAIVAASAWLLLLLAGRLKPARDEAK